MSVELIPADVRQRFHIEERAHACAILAADFSAELADIVACLRGFSLKQTEILKAGGSKSPIAKAIDDFLRQRGWTERKFDTKIVVDEKEWPDTDA